MEGGFYFESIPRNKYDFLNLEEHLMISWKFNMVMRSLHDLVRMEDSFVNDSNILLFSKNNQDKYILRNE